MYRLITLGLLTLATPSFAQDWGQLATISSTMSVQGGRLCLGEASRGDIGCPAYAPSVTTNGSLTATKFIGDGSGLTNLPQGTTALTGNVTGSGIGTITTTLADDAVTTAKIAAGAVTANELASNAVTTVKLPDNTVTLPKIQNISTNRLLGRATAGTGNIEQITVGSGLSFTGSTLTATAGGECTINASTVNGSCGGSTPACPTNYTRIMSTSTGSGCSGETKVTATCLRVRC